MRVFTDSIPFVERLTLPTTIPWSSAAPAPDILPLVRELYGDQLIQTTTVESATHWPYLCASASAERSQFDLLVGLSRASAALPDGTLCLAGAGRGLHGQRGRPWAALEGNLHLSLWLTPPPEAVHTPIDLLAMAAVSVVEAIDAVPGLAGRAGIKWVNDILIDGAKVCGILTHVAHRPRGVLGIVGIGLNVEAVPEVAPTPFVPTLTALRAVTSDPEQCRLGSVLHVLLVTLDRNYATLRGEGARGLFARYRERSLVLGRQVALCAEHPDATPEVVAEGRVVGLGDSLELLLEGHDRPFTTGRLILRA
ncbi:MAG: biotin--[acetyl-CoA-carboxylase] ligase [Gemmatimonadota bacterium]|nr:biotin--[acetyl-CoA-carboxylase] ligase [Gemmatimonadota bacterium]MDH5198762.1 biotin--[acetyl-CoA-carboxylase] ligase [Gemmatimonadota bacterium]